MAVFDGEIYNSIIDEVANILTECKEQIQSNMAAKGINASGRTSEGFMVERYENGVRLVLKGQQVAPLYTLETGRGGGGVPMGFTAIIEQWSRDKGLQFANDQDRRRFSFLTARKIASEGTQRNKLPEDVYSEPVNDALAKMRKTVKASVSQYVRYISMGVKPHYKNT